MARGVVWCAVAVTSLFVMVGGELTVTKPELQDAVDSLSAMFHRVRNEGLGIQALEEAIQNVSFKVTGELGTSEIGSGLQADQISNAVNNTVELFESVSSVVAAGVGTSVAPVLCSTSSSTGACYQGPQSTSPDSLVFGQLNTASGLAEGQVVKFGAPDGTVISTPPSAGSDDVDSRVLPWFVQGARVNSAPLEVVILMDLLDNTDGLLNRTKEAARSVVQSLSSRDKVGVVMFDLVLRVANSAREEVQPICDSTITEIDSLITSITPEPAPLSSPTLGAGIQRANGLFSNSNQTEKHLLFFTLSVLGSGDVRTTLTNAAQSGLDSGVRFSIFYGSQFTRDAAMEAATAATTGIAVRLEAGVNFLNLVGLYSVPSTFNSSNTDVLVGRNNVARQGALLTLTRSVFNDTTFMGVLYTSIPFSTLIPAALNLLQARRLSYVFVAEGSAGWPGLLHPLLPGDSLASVNVDVLEPEGVITSYLDSSDMGNGAPVVKTRLFNTGSASSHHTYAIRNISSTYYCNTHTTLAGNFAVCLVLADGEQTLRGLDTDFVDVQNLYNRYAAPIYHNIQYSAGDLPVCNYFCKNSVNTHISFQLTTPSAPGVEETMSLVTEVSRYIQSAQSRPSYVEEGVAEEAAVSLAVGSFWLNKNTRPSDFITRRHLATPNGLYLTYPPTHLVSNFAPSRTEWYLTAVSQPTFLTLSPPHRDPLQEGSDVTLSLGGVVLPPGSTDALPFAVVSGEITRNSLQVLMDEALPACSSYECILFDDRGNLLYKNNADAIPDSARFLDRDTTLLANLLELSRSSWLEKTQCQDLFNVNIDTNRFYLVNIGADEVISSSPNHCNSYLIQRVPSMNIFLAVHDRASRDGNCTKSLCFCSVGTASCLNCDSYVPDFCECPCSCPGNCDALEVNVPLCPLNVLESPNFSARTDFTPTSQDSLCFNQECRCRANFSSCYGVRDCHWCDREQKCVQNTECCDATTGFQCCQSESRINNLCEQYRGQCFNNPSGVLPTSCDFGVSTDDFTGPTQAPRTSQTTAIIAGVVGAILGLLLILLIVALLIYYQFFRKVDPQEETSRESAFDFSNKTALSGGSGGSSDGKTKAKKEKEKEAQGEKEPTPEKEQDEATV